MSFRNDHLLKWEMHLYNREKLGMNRRLFRERWIVGEKHEFLGTNDTNYWGGNTDF